MEMNDVLKVLKGDEWPKTPVGVANRLSKFKAAFSKYVAEGGSSAALLRSEAGAFLQKNGIRTYSQVLEDCLKGIESSSSNSPTAAEKSPEELEAEKLARIEELRPLVKQVLEHEDPLQLVVADMTASGFAGDTTGAAATYVAVTTRLLPIAPGHLPCHIARVSTSGEGKSYATKIVLARLPEIAKCTFDAGSPRAFIYSQESLIHRVLFFTEIDSLPEGEDSPVASAIRTLLTDGQVSYHTVEKNPATNRMESRAVVRKGPTVLLTTSTRSLDGKQGTQMATRLFSIPLDESEEQHAAALKVIAKQVNGELQLESDPALVGYQEYLQLLAPWRVVIPFADQLAVAIGKVATKGRIMRDFSRLLSLIKAVTILRHTYRRKLEDGAYVATLADYATVRDLVGEVFAGSATGATREIHTVVQAVDTVMKKTGAGSVSCVSQPDLFKELRGQLSPETISRCVYAALKEGWLVNGAEGKAWDWELSLGSSLPNWTGLPSAEDLKEGEDVYEATQDAIWLDKAKTYLQEALVDGYRLKKDLVREAAKLGISVGSLNRAKDLLQVTQFTVPGMQGTPQAWKLPG